MFLRRFIPFRGLLLLFSASLLYAQPARYDPPDIQLILRRVQDHQRQVEAMRENYTYDCQQTTQYLAASGEVKKTETEQREEFFVNGHLIGRVVKRNGQPLTGDDLDKENRRVMELVEKAQTTPPGQRLEGPSITLSRVLELMDLSNPRREVFHDRPTFVFDFVGRKDAKTHGMMEDASKKLRGTVWIDEADLQVAQLEVTVADNFRIAGGLLASVEKGSSYRFDQARVDAGLWLPTGSASDMQARILMLKNLRERQIQRDYGFQRFNVATGQAGKATGRQ